MSTRIPPDQLAHRCDPAAFGFATTAELPDLDDAPGQGRAAEAVGFGVDMGHEGYNLFVMGPPGSGRHRLVRAAIAARGDGVPHPPDWVYVNNFEDPHRPIAIDLPPGGALKLRDAIAALVDELRAGIPAVFESEEYSSRVESIDAEFKERHEKAFSDLGEEAGAQQLALLRTPAGFAFAPVKDGEIMGPDVFAKLPEDEQKKIEAAIPVLQEKLEKILREAMRWRKERVERIKALNREMTMMVTGHLVEDLKRDYAALPKVVAHLDALQADVLDNADDFKKPAEGEQPLMRFVQSDDGQLRRYLVNVLVDHSPPNGLPVVDTDHPTHQNLVGRIDHVARFGTLVTDFSQIKAGDLHRANGGYLLLDAARVLTEPFAWAGLKRALQRREIRIESLADMYGGVSTSSLAPEPIPLNVKVILFGDRRLLYLLAEYDPDCANLFRVVADFEDDLDRGDTSNLQYAQLAGTLARREKLLPLGREAVARVIDHASRRAGDTKKLSADVRGLEDLLKEADYHARHAARPAIAPEDVALAVEAQRRRASRLHEGMQEAIVRGKLLIDTDGAKVGQVNGLSVYQLGDYAFGQPTRITATTRLGEGQVIDIQREVQMGGAIHSKGVMILAAYLGSRYSGSRTLALSASLVFEQTYGAVDGDSASLAELCALLSSLSGVPLLQSMAVTGSINQLGEVQPIGAANEKIEGF
ncbi:MAG: AAA family ATPase, partial [Proteobacteria bacterium]|nr:AAA family ATPase [Pseudomonadota bacterium]